MKDLVPDLPEGDSVSVLRDDYLYGELRVIAERLGIDTDRYAYKAVERVLEKVSGGVSFSRACNSAGISFEKLRELAESDAGLRNLFYEAGHKFEMRALESIARGVESDHKFALDVLSRRNDDFAPAKREVEVRNIDIREGMLIDVD